MRFERFEESADMVVVARNNDLRALFDMHAPATVAIKRPLLLCHLHLPRAYLSLLLLKRNHVAGDRKCACYIPSTSNVR